MHPRSLTAFGRSGSVLTFTALALACSLPAHAVDWDFSGFASVVAGRTFGDCTPDATMAPRYSEPCSRYIADWSHAGVYTPRLSASEESRLG